MHSKVNYSALISQWKLSEMREMDKLIARILSPICYNQLSFPHALYYCGRSVGRLGLTAIADLIPLRKLHQVRKRLADEDEKLNIEAFIARSIHFSCSPSLGYSYWLQNTRTSWMGSIVELANELGIRLYSEGVSSINTSDAIISSFDIFSNNDIHQLNSIGISTLGDLRTSYNTWMTSKQLGIEHDRHTHCSLDTVTYQPRAGQTWYIESWDQLVGNQAIIKITNITTTNIFFDIFKPYGGSVRRFLRSNTLYHVTHSFSTLIATLLPLMRYRVLLQPTIDGKYLLIYKEKINPDIHYSLHTINISVNTGSTSDNNCDRCDTNTGNGDNNRTQ